MKLVLLVLSKLNVNAELCFQNYMDKTIAQSCTALTGSRVEGHSTEETSIVSDAWGVMCVWSYSRKILLGNYSYRLSLLRETSVAHRVIVALAFLRFLSARCMKRIAWTHNGEAMTDSPLDSFTKVSEGFFSVCFWTSSPQIYWDTSFVVHVAVMQYLF